MKVKLIVKYYFLYQKCLGGSENDDVNSIMQTNDNGYIVGGSTFSNNGDIKGNHGNYDIWVVKFSQDTITVNVEDELKIFPKDKYIFNILQNTNNDNIKLEYFLNDISNINISIFNELGIKIKTVTIKSDFELSWQSQNIDISDIYSGIYFLTLNVGSYIETKKIIVNN